MMYIEIKTAQKSFESLRKRAIRIIDFEKKMKLSIKEQQESYENAKICYIFKKNRK